MILVRRQRFAPGHAATMCLAVVVVAGCLGQGREHRAAGRAASEGEPVGDRGNSMATPTVVSLATDRFTSVQPSVAPATHAVEPGLVGPSPTPGRFAMDLYRRGDFVSQATIEWCVPAAILTMANVVGGGRAERMPTQAALDRMARSLSSSRLVGAGSEPEGWARTLGRLGFGPYVVTAERTRERALRAAALAIRRTGRPVGVLIWRGAHAWVMTGFEATADPASTENFRVTAVRVSDPWYPRPIGTWGRTRGPDARVRVDRLTRAYLRWRRPTVRYAELDGRFVLVLPVGRARSDRHVVH